MASDPSLEARENHVLRVAVARGFLDHTQAERVLASAPAGQRLATLGARLPPEQLGVLRAAYADFPSAPETAPAASDPEGTLAPGAAGAVVESSAPAQAASRGRGPRLPQPGERVDGYEVLRLLGRGGMGAVYVARDPAGREVALKVHLGSSDERFRVEGEAVARLDHEGIVKIHALGTDPEGHLYCVMGLVPGGALDAYLAERRVLPLREAVEITLQAARALGYAHQQQVLHRDIKPANLLRTPEGRIVITDFGLARVVDQSQQLSQTGQLLGTPAYMSPEQARGEVRSIGPGADIYSLGATLYDLLTERPPFADLPPIQLLLSVANLEPAPPSAHRAEIDPALDAIVLRCLAKQPAERYASMEALAADLEGYLREGASGVQAYAAARRPTRWPLALGALGLLVPLLAVVVALGEERGAESAAPGAGASPRVAGAASPAPRAQLAPAAVAPPEGELLGTLDSEGELLVQARAGDASLLFSLSGPPGAEVEIEGGGALRRVRCEAGWATPAQIVRSPSSYQPLQVGTYRLTLAPGESRPVQVGFQRLKKKTRAISVEPFAVFPPVELCLEDPERRESATKLLDQLRTVLQLRRSGKRVAPPPGLFKLLGELREAEGGRLFGLFEAVFGAYRTTLRPGPEEYAPAQELAIELLDDFPDVLAVRWHAAQGLLARQRYAEAAASFARGLELAPQRFELREGQLRSLLLAGQREEAYLAAEQVIALAPGSWDTQGWHALASYAVGRADAKAAERLMVALDKRRKVERLVGWLTQLDALFATDPAPAGVAELARIYLTRAAQYMGGAYDAQPVLGWQALARLRAVQLLQGVEPARRLWKISPQAAKGDAEARARYAALGEELGVAK